MKGTDGPSPTGTVDLYIDEQVVGTVDIKTQPGAFSLAGEGLAVGRDSGQPVSS